MWRRFEDKCRSLYLKQKIRGFLHLYNGQEAIPAGFAHAMDMTKDSMITSHQHNRPDSGSDFLSCLYGRSRSTGIQRPGQHFLSCLYGRSLHNKISRQILIFLSCLYGRSPAPGVPSRWPTFLSCLYGRSQGTPGAGPGCPFLSCLYGRSLWDFFARLV